MEEEKNHIDEIFRRELSNQSIDPPDEIWANVQSGIIVRKNKRLVPFFYRIAAGIAILISTAFGILYLMNLSPDKAISDITPEKPLFIQAETKTIIEEKSSGSAPGGMKELEISVSSPEINPETEIVQSDPVSQKPEIAIHAKEIIPLPTGSKELIASIPWLQVNAGQYQLAELHTREIPETILPVKEKSNRQWDFGFHSAPSYTYRTISGLNGSGEVFSYLNQAEKGKLSFSGYLYIRTKLSRRLGLRTGFHFSNQGYSTGGIARISNLEDNPIVPVSSLDWNSFLLALTNSAGSVNYRTNVLLVNQLNTRAVYALSEAFPASDIGSEPDYRIVQNLYYMGIPIEGILYPGQKQYFYLTFGFEPGILLGNSVYFDSGESLTRIGNIEGLNKFYYSTSIGIGLEMPLSGSLFITLEPGFQYFLSAINPNHIVSSRPWSFSLALGINFQR